MSSPRPRVAPHRPSVFSVADLRSPPTPERHPFVVILLEELGVAQAVRSTLSGRFITLPPLTCPETALSAVPMLDRAVLLSEPVYSVGWMTDALGALAESSSRLRVVIWYGDIPGRMKECLLRDGRFCTLSRKAPLTHLCSLLTSEANRLQVSDMNPSNAAQCIPRSPGSRSHDRGNMIRWALGAGFRRSAIARVLQVSPQTVAYHAQRAEPIQLNG